MILLFNIEVIEENQELEKTVSLESSTVQVSSETGNYT